MGLTHAEFFRTLPAAMGDWPYRVEDKTVVAERDGGRLTISLGPQQERRIALMRVPNVDVQFVFDGFETDVIKAFMRYFESRFQRGGG